MNEAQKEKLTAKKLVSYAPSEMARLNRVAALRKEDSSEIIRRGTASELDRLEALTAVEIQRMEKLKALAAAQGGDIDATLDRLTRELVEPQLPLAATG